MRQTTQRDGAEHAVGLRGMAAVLMAQSHAQQQEVPQGLVLVRRGQPPVELVVHGQRRLKVVVQVELVGQLEGKRLRASAGLVSPKGMGLPKEIHRVWAQAPPGETSRRETRPLPPVGVTPASLPRSDAAAGPWSACLFRWAGRRGFFRRRFRRGERVCGYWGRSADQQNTHDGYADEQDAGRQDLLDQGELTPGMVEAAADSG